MKTRLTASGLEALLQFEPPKGKAELVTSTLWTEPFDSAIIRFSNTSDEIKEHIDYQLQLNLAGEIECINVNIESKSVQLKSEFQKASRTFLTPINLHKVSEYGNQIEAIFLKLMSERLSELEDLKSRITGESWVIKRGQPSPDLPYARLSSLFVSIQEFNESSTLLTCSSFLGVPYETLKTRLRTAKDKGLLTSPGMGSTKSKLTQKAKSILEKDKS